MWAQWRWEHDLPDYAARVRRSRPPRRAAAPVARRAAADVELLAFCGGGKDSLVALKLLERARLPFATLGYAHSIYGDAAHQHALLDRVAGATARVRAERQWVIDDFLDAPVVTLRPDARRDVAARGRDAGVGVRRAAARARARLSRARRRARGERERRRTSCGDGEDVNHQWGKGWEAEQLARRLRAQQLLAERSLLQRARSRSTTR